MSTHSEPVHESIPGITLMAVHPEHQRQGIGSMLLELFCHEIDHNTLDSFVTSSPLGSGYTPSLDIVGSAETDEGRFMSTLRALESRLGRKNGPSEQY